MFQKCFLKKQHLNTTLFLLLWKLHRVRVSVRIRVRFGLALGFFQKGANTENCIGQKARALVLTLC